MDTTKIGFKLTRAFVGWAPCVATMGIGVALLPPAPVLVTPNIASPVFFTMQ